MGSAPSWTDGRAWPRTTGIGARLRTSSQVAAVTSAALALAVGALAVWLSIAPFGARLSALVRMSAGDPIARVAGAADGAWAFVGSHYDGIYFFTIGIDPIAKGTAHTLIDQAAYRYGHPAYGWIAGALALFDPRWLPLTLPLVSLLSIAVAGWGLARVAQLLGASGWIGALVALNPGLIFAVANDTSEALGAALLLLTLWAWLTSRYRLASLLLVPLCFTKEPLLLVPIALAGWETLQWLRSGDRAAWLGRLVFLAPGPLLYVAWSVYVAVTFGQSSFTGAGLLSLPVPLAGWVDALGKAAAMAGGDFSAMQIGAGMLPIELASLAALLIGMGLAARLRTPVDAVLLLLSSVMCFLSWLQVLYPKDLIRTLALVWLLVPLTLVSRAAVRADHPERVAEGIASER